jgi:hypothetical protein
LQDATGKPLPEFEASDFVEIIGAEIERPVRWQGGSDVSLLAGQLVRRRFLEDADLYSFQFISGD